MPRYPIPNSMRVAMSRLFEVLPAPPQLLRSRSRVCRKCHSFPDLRLPDDYSEFVHHYGSGVVGETSGHMALCSILDITYESPEFDQAMDFCREEQYLGLRIVRGALPVGIKTVSQIKVCPKLPGLLAWGFDSQGNTLTWLASDANPNSWPIISTRTADLQIIECGFAELMLGSMFDDPVNNMIPGDDRNTDQWGYDHYIR